MMTERMVTVAYARLRALRQTFEAFTIAEVDRHGGIPHLRPEDVEVRAAIAELLAQVPPEDALDAALLAAPAVPPEDIREAFTRDAIAELKDPDR